MRPEKTQIVNDIGRIISETDFVFLITYKGLPVSKFSDLRKSLAQKNAQCTVLKNSLIRKAAEQKGMSKLSEIKLKGDTAVVTGKGDIGAVAKILADFAKANEVVSSKGGYLEGALLTAADVKAIASLPTRDVLRSQLLGVLQAPARNLASVLYVKLSEIANVLNNRKEALEKKQ